MKNQTILYVIRHGEAQHNVLQSTLSRDAAFAKRRDAEFSDPALTTTGLAQAETAAEALAAQLAHAGDEPPNFIVSSTLRRALQTAEVAAAPVAPEAKLVALETACEIQFGDIWNEPREAGAVASDWPKWTVAPYNDMWRGYGELPHRLETADKLIGRVEKVWRELARLSADHGQGAVLVLVAHGCFLSFLMARLSAAAQDEVMDHTTFFENAEVRRLQMPEPDGRQLQWLQLTQELAAMNNPVAQDRIEFWTRFSNRATAIDRAVSSGLAGTMPAWSQTEWRYARTCVKCEELRKVSSSDWYCPDCK